MSFCQHGMPGLTSVEGVYDMGLLVIQVCRVGVCMVCVLCPHSTCTIEGVMLQLSHRVLVFHAN